MRMSAVPSEHSPNVSKISPRNSKPVTSARPPCGGRACFGAGARDAGKSALPCRVHIELVLYGHILLARDLDRVGRWGVFTRGRTSLNVCGAEASGHQEVDGGWSVRVFAGRRGRREDEGVGRPVSCRTGSPRIPSGIISLEGEAGWEREPPEEYCR